MPAVPRIARISPEGTITRPAVGIPVIARLRWAHGKDSDVVALAIAWTRQAVEIRWQEPGIDERTDWIDARDVRRTAAEPAEDPSRPPTSRGMLKKNRW